MLGSRKGQQVEDEGLGLVNLDLWLSLRCPFLLQSMTSCGEDFT